MRETCRRAAQHCDTVYNDERAVDGATNEADYKEIRGPVGGGAR